MTSDSDPEQSSRFTRRVLLRHSVSGGAALSLAALIAACGGEEEAAAPPPPAEPAPTVAEPPPPAEPAPAEPPAEPAPAEPPAETGPKTGGRLRLGLSGGGTGETLDPHKGAALIDKARESNLFDKLVDVTGPFPREAYGVLAESMEPNADGSVWQIKLRQGVTFHDGKPLTADDVLYTFRRILDPDQAITLAASLGSIDMEGTKKVDDLTIDLVLKAPDATLNTTSSPFLKIDIVADGTTDFSTPNGTGPFKFESWAPGQQSLFVRNENYFETGKPYVDELELVSLNDGQARLNALLSGQVDAIESLDYPQAKAQQDNPAIQILEAQGAANAPLYMWTDGEPFGDPRVRVAFKLAVDRQQIVDTAYLGFGIVGNDIWGPAWPSYNTELEQREYDPEQAKALLKEAGYENLKVTLVTAPVLPGFVETATTFAENAKAAGINVELQQISAGDYFNSELNYLKVPFYQTTWGGGAFEFVAIQGMLCPAKGNETHWCRPEWEKQLKDATALLDEDARNQAIKETQLLVWEEGGYIIPAYGSQLDAAAPNVMGFEAGARGAFGGNYDFKNYWLA